MGNYFELAQAIIGDGCGAQELISKGYAKEDIENVELLQRLLEENNYKCNADGRAYVAERMPKLKKRTFDEDLFMQALEEAEKIGGCRPGTKYRYVDARGENAVAKVCSLYKLPSRMVNPYLVVFSGMMTAPIYAMEILRFYAKQHDELLPLVAIGKGGNKGLYESVFNRQEGIMIGSEYGAYLNMLEMMAPSGYVRQNEKVFTDMDTEGNLYELYRFAQEQNLDEVTYVLCTGNFSYDKRLLAEWMLMLKRPEFAGVKINIVLAHCPLCLNFQVPEGHLSEIMLGYIAASIGPLMKDTISFDGKTSSEHPERYLMPGVANAKWHLVQDIISEYSNMGWPNYMEILYGEDHKVAVAKIILSDLLAKNSFTPEMYDRGIQQDITNYQSLVGKYYGGSFLRYLKNTIDYEFFV